MGKDGVTGKDGVRAPLVIREREMVSLVIDADRWVCYVPGMARPLRIQFADALYHVGKNAIEGQMPK